MPQPKLHGSSLMSAFNMKDKYVKFLPDLFRRETFEEAVHRMMGMHREFYNVPELEEVYPELLEAMEEIEASILRKDFLGAQRSLQYGGPGVLKHHCRQYNCTATYINRVRVFQEIMYSLLCGEGVGISIQKHHIAQLPPLRDRKSEREEVEFVISDSIEGWSDAVGAEMSFWLGQTDELPVFDYSQIRPEGAALSIGGKAPGPEPLRKALELIRERLFEIVYTNGRKLIRPDEVTDIICILSDAVVSGGHRRAALIGLFSPDDERMIRYKTGNWFEEHPYRGRINISMALIRGNKTHLEYFKLAMRSVRHSGDPGFIFLSSTEHLYNPCAEAQLVPVFITDPEGKPVENYTLDLLNFSKRKHWESLGYKFEYGFQHCNLVEINAANITSEEEFARRVKLSTILGTFQAGYTSFPYLGDVTERIVRREALLGVSMTGVFDNHTFILNYPMLRRMAELAVETNKVWAEKIGIRQATRVTVGKPAGNTTITFSDRYYMSSGFSLHKGRGRMLRRIQVKKNSPVAQFFESINPHMVETSLWNSSGSDWVITFPVEASPDTLAVGDISAIEYLSMLKDSFQAWVVHGTALPDRVEGACHNIANTCEVGSKEWSEVGRYIWENQDSFAGISLLSSAAAYLYAQSPMQPLVSQTELLDEYGELNVVGARIIRDMLDDLGLPIHKVAHPIMEYARDGRSEKAAETYGLNRTFFRLLLDEIHKRLNVPSIHDALKLLATVKDDEIWDELTSKMKDVDYSELLEFEDATSASEAVACAGGACLI